LRGQRRLASVRAAPLARADGLGFLLPVELRHANHTASTNGRDSRCKTGATPTIESAMASADQLEQIAERVERLLVRYEELQRTNALLVQQVELLTQERDSLKSRLSAARSRVDALLERLPDIKAA
jgi:uncharacterized protein (TIGR02449 family)